MRISDWSADVCSSDLALQQLHERDRVGGEVVSARCVHCRVAAARNVDHRRDLEFAHRLLDREPVFIGQRRVGKVAAARIGVEVADYEVQFLEAAAQFLHARSEEHTSALQSLMRISYAVFCWQK